MYDDLERLQALREKGTITEEEFQREKKRILDDAERKSNFTSSDFDKKPLWGLDERNYITIMHASQFAGTVIPLAGYIVPVLMWLQGKESSAAIDVHGKHIINWMISLFIYVCIASILVFVGIGVFMLVALGIINLVFVIKGAIRASEGIVWPYPMTIKFID